MTTTLGEPGLHVVILAAGKGTRMKSSLPKVLHRLAGRTLLDHVLQSVAPLHPSSTVVIVGHGADQVEASLTDRTGIEFVLQSSQLGTGHALLQAEPALRGRTGTVLLVYADVPLLRTTTLQRLLDVHRSSAAVATVLTASFDDPSGYGRIVRNSRGDIIRIVEQRDATSEERSIREVNSGIYAFDLAPLFPALKGLATNNTQGEYYLTDLVAAYATSERRVETVALDNAEEMRGVNSRVDLAALTQVMRERKNHETMLAGATLEDPSTIAIDQDVTIGPDTIIGASVRLEGRTTIGERCRIQSGVRLTNATIGDDVTILDYSVIIDSRVNEGASVGPFAHLRPGSVIGEGAHIGNFVELKKTTVGAGSKAGHLSYLGDATIGRNVNIGAGTITCNFDGEKKNPTVIEDGVFVGSDSQLVAPVRLGEGSYIAAGSSITTDVPGGALAISRARQENKPDWLARRRAYKGQDKK